MEGNTEYPKYLGHSVHSDSFSTSSSPYTFSRLEFTTHVGLASTISLHNKLSY